MSLQDPPFLSLSGDSQPLGNNLFAALPREILTHILQDVLVSECEGSPSSYYSATHAFTRLLTTCSTFYDVGIPILYAHAAFSDPQSFDRFLKSIRQTGYGHLVRTLDFSGFTSVGLGRTARMNNDIQMLTPKTLTEALHLCPNLIEFLGTENIEKDMDSDVLATLFSMPYLAAVDFCGATHSAFVDALEATLAHSHKGSLDHITRLSLHGCSTLSTQTIQQMLQLLPNLTRLDLTHTRVTTQALMALPSTARLTHLSLSKCVHLDSAHTRQFLLAHKATRYLHWLNLMFDITRPAPISAKDLLLIVASLPPSIQHLNLHGLPVTGMPLKDPSNVESLSLGYANVTIPELKKFLPTLPRLEYLDLTGNPHINIWTVQDETLLNCNPTIRMFEFSSDLLSKMDGIAVPGFTAAKGQGRRGWLIRGPTVPCTTSLSYTTHSGPSAVSGPEIAPSISSPDHKRFTFSAYAKSRMCADSSSPRAAPASPPTASMAGRSPRSHFHQQSRSRSPETRPVTVLGMDMGAPDWRHASRKTNVCYVGIGGSRAVDSCKERGIYLYYGYRK